MTQNIDEMIAAALERGEPVGWTVTDPDGNVIQSGGITAAKAAGGVAQLLESLEE